LKKSAMIFVGEGARGAWQAGVACRVIDDVKPDMVFGISSGAVNAICLTYAPKQYLWDLWANVRSISDIFSFNYFTFYKARGLYNSRKVGKIAQKFFTANRRESYPRKACIGRCDATTGLLEYHDVCPIVDTREHVTELLRDAICISGLIEPREGTSFVDAGSRELNPMGRAVEMGYNELHVIIGSGLEAPKFQSSWWFFPSIEYALRSMFISMHESILNDLADIRLKAVDVYVYVPQFELPGNLEFAKCKEMLTDGYYNHRIFKA
jgi:predicted acylesterase/phospholipase RssA